MLIFDQLKKDDPHLRFLAFVVLGGILILLTGLWWVQLVSTKYFRGRLEHQSTRTVGIPAVRGKILDRNGRPLAENRPAYSIDLYLGELSRSYQKAYNQRLGQIQTNLHLQLVAKEKQLGRKLTSEEKKPFLLNQQFKDQLEKQVRYEVTSNLLLNLSAKLQQPISLTQSNFEKWYYKSRMLPMPVLPNLNAAEIARFEEQSTTVPGVDLDVQSVRYYPNGTSAAHLLGYLSHDDSASDNFYSFPATGYTGAAGIEKIYDDQLHGETGERSVTINNYGFRQTEAVGSPPVAGQNIVLTIDADVQRAADLALESRAHESLHGAVVVMDVRNGDILALASAPTYNPNHFIKHPEDNTWQYEWARWTNEDLQVQMNHAVQGLYPPGSIFKIVVGLAGLENGTLNPKEKIYSPGYVPIPGRSRPMRDTAPAGDYELNRALALSCNFYFVTNGLKPGVLPRVIALGERLHFGERTGLFPRNFESRGYFPKPNDIKSSSWHLGNTANMSIGQDRLTITPLQAAVMISAIANGGTVLYPRIIERIESYDSDEVIQKFPDHQVRDNLGVSARNLSIVREAMREDVEGTEGTGHAAAVSGMTIYGKTGTAQVEKWDGSHYAVDKSAQVTWFGSFASTTPDGSPKYAVVAMLAGGSSGGGTCAPIAHDVYLALQQMERRPPAKPAALAQAK
jgi:penicillin-binding protein 2